MTAFPSAVSRAPAKAFEGMLANGRPAVIDSKVVKTTAGINAGRFVCWHAGDDDQGARLPTTAAEVQNNNAMGVSILDVTKMNPDGSTGGVTQVNEPLAALRDGEVWVLVEEAVTPASLVYVRITESTGGAADTGKFRASGDSAKAVIAYGFKYMTSTTGAGLALLSVKIPQGNVSLPTA